MIYLVLLLENLLFPFVAIGVVIKFALSGRRSVLIDLPSEIAERFGKLGAAAREKLAQRPVLWVHAASAGEVSAISEFLKRIKERSSPPAILVTCSTASGRRKAASLPCVDVAALAPVDFFPIVARFLRAVKPYALILVETELWPHLIEVSHHRGIKISLVNGRISPNNFKRLKPFSFFIKPFINRIGRLAAQSEEDRLRFISLGVNPQNVAAMGNMKYDITAGASPNAAIDGALTQLNWHSSPLFVAGSTHPGEEEIVLQAYLQARKQFPDLKLVIAPRHIERAANTGQLLDKLGLRHASWSKLSVSAPDVLLLDTLGILPSFYAKAALSFVGGTLVPVGGHNVMEPALAGSPVAFGPYTSHTEEAARLLESKGGARRVKNAEELSKAITEVLIDPRHGQELGLLARQTAQSLQGATQRTIGFLDLFLKPAEKLS